MAETEQLEKGEGCGVSYQIVKYMLLD